MAFGATNRIARSFDHQIRGVGEVVPFREDPPKNAGEVDLKKIREWDRAQRTGPIGKDGNIGAEADIQAQRPLASEMRNKALSKIADVRAQANRIEKSNPYVAAELRREAGKLERDVLVLDKALMSAAADYSSIDVKGGVDQGRGQVPGWTRLSYEDLSKPIAVKQKDGSVRTMTLDPEDFNLVRGKVVIPDGTAYNDARLHRVVLFRNDETGAYVAAFQQTQFIFGPDPKSPFGEEKGLGSDPTQISNQKQSVGLGSPYYDNAIDLTRKLKDQLGDPQGGFSLTGSSKGGGLATAAGLVTNTQADVFNPAWVHRDTLIENGFSRWSDPNLAARAVQVDGRHLIDAYVVPYDLVNNGFYIPRVIEKIVQAPFSPSLSPIRPAIQPTIIADVRGVLNELPQRGFPRANEVIPTILADAHGGWQGATAEMVKDRIDALDKKSSGSYGAKPNDPIPAPLPTPTPIPNAAGTKKGDSGATLGSGVGIDSTVGKPANNEQVARDFIKNEALSKVKPKQISVLEVGSVEDKTLTRDRQTMRNFLAGSKPGRKIEWAWNVKTTTKSGKTVYQEGSSGTFELQRNGKWKYASGNPPFRSLDNYINRNVSNADLMKDVIGRVELETASTSK
jgi:hypothetical protein